MSAEVAHVEAICRAAVPLYRLSTQRDAPASPDRTAAGARPPARARSGRTHRVGVPATRALNARASRAPPAVTIKTTKVDIINDINLKKLYRTCFL